MDWLFGEEIVQQLGGFCWPVATTDRTGSSEADPSDAWQALEIFRGAQGCEGSESADWVFKAKVGAIRYDAFTMTFHTRADWCQSEPTSPAIGQKEIDAMSKEEVKTLARSFCREAPTLPSSLAYIRMLEAFVHAKSTVGSATTHTLPSEALKGGAVLRAGSGSRAREAHGHQLSNTPLSGRAPTTNADSSNQAWHVPRLRPVCKPDDRRERFSTLPGMRVKEHAWPATKERAPQPGGTT